MDKLKPCIHGKIDTGEVDLYLTLAVYNFGFWFNGVRGFVILDDMDPVVAEVSTSGDYTIYSLSGNCSSEYINRLEWSLGIQEDLTMFYKLGMDDPLLGEFIRKYYGWRLRSTSLWWALIIGVCQQNASFIQGWRMLYNIIRLYNRKVLVGKAEVLLPPTPYDIVSNKALLINAGTGYRANTIYNVAKTFANKELDQDVLVKSSSIDIEEELKRIKGIGSYTARLSIVLAFRKYDLPPIDRWLRKIISLVYKVSLKDSEKMWMRKWGKWSGLAALATTIALDAKPLSKAIERIKNRQLAPIDENKPTPLNLWKFLK
ncbi:MAG: hypothetical protein DRO40_08965 [Thermoprotei archaeon]|nr:MAG: hypothetical protein DRO40_08965 [Thermoprotei archaeon]